MLVSANFALSGQVAWTPGGFAIAFARMLQDGIVTRYLNDHCATQHFKLCPYRNNLPETADDFLWSRETVFNKLGRFPGMSDEMGYIAVHALADYPLWQAEEALLATGEQMLKVATGENTDHPTLMHTYGIFREYLPQQLKQVDAAREQKSHLTFGPINLVHVPVALASTALVFAMLLAPGLPAPVRRRDAVDGHRGSGVARQCRHMRRDIGTARSLWLTPGLDHNIHPHDRGHEAIKTAKSVTGGVTENPARPSCKPCRRPRACDRDWECRELPRPE